MPTGLTTLRRLAREHRWNRGVPREAAGRAGGKGTGDGSPDREGIPLRDLTLHRRRIRVHDDAHERVGRLPPDREALSRVPAATGRLLPGELRPRRTRFASAHPRARGVTFTGARIEVLDHDKARALVDNASRLAVGTCSCRHEKLHLGAPRCSAPLQSCIQIDGGTDYVVRHDMARMASKDEVRELLAQARELKLVMNADNVRSGVSFLCLCCGWLLQRVERHQAAWGSRMSWSPRLSSPRAMRRSAKGCGRCATACPIDAIHMTARESGKLPSPRVDTTVCIGCGVCGLSCPSRAMRLVGEKAACAPAGEHDRADHSPGN